MFVSAAKLHVLAKALPKVASRIKHGVVYWGAMAPTAEPALEVGAEPGTAGSWEGRPHVLMRLHAQCWGCSVEALAVPLSMSSHAS